jgi:hypothetical protein
MFVSCSSSRLVPVSFFFFFFPSRSWFRHHANPYSGQPFAAAQFANSRWPARLAIKSVRLVHGQPFARAH